MVLVVDKLDYNYKGIKCKLLSPLGRHFLHVSMPCTIMDFVNGIKPLCDFYPTDQYPEKNDVPFPDTCMLIISGDKDYKVPMMKNNGHLDFRYPDSQCLYDYMTYTSAPYLAQLYFKVG